MTPSERKEFNELAAKYPSVHRRILEAQFLHDRNQRRIALRKATKERFNAQ